MVGLLLAISVGTRALSAQTVHRLTGSVIDSATGRGIAQGATLIPERGIVGPLAPDGGFELPGIAPGSYTLVIRAGGHRSRAMAFTLGAQHDTVVSVGIIELPAGTDRRTRVVGTVRSSLGDEIPHARIALDGRLVTTSDERGAYGLDDVARGLHVLEIRTVGFRPAILQIDVPADQPEQTLDLTMEQLPIELEPIVVDADRVAYVRPRLREFYERRRRGLGTFITRWDIEQRRPHATTDLFRRILGIRVVPGQFGTYQLLTTRAFKCSTPLVYLDGLPMVNGDIDLWVLPDDIEGIEVFPGTAAAPIEYSRGTGCGVVLIWTK